MSNFSGMMGSTKEAEIDGKKLEGEETEIVNVTPLSRGSSVKGRGKNKC